MCSTPEAITSSWVPEAISAAAVATADCAEPQRRSIVIAGTSTGKPACSQALRAMLRDCSPNGAVQPAMTSSTSAGSMPVRSTSASKQRAEQRVGVGVAERALLGMRAADRRAQRLGDHDLAAGWRANVGHHITIPPSTHRTWPVM